MAHLPTINHCSLPQCHLAGVSRPVLMGHCRHRSQVTVASAQRDTHVPPHASHASQRTLQQFKLLEHSTNSGHSSPDGLVRKERTIFRSGPRARSVAVSCCCAKSNWLAITASHFSCCVAGCFVHHMGWIDSCNRLHRLVESTCKGSPPCHSMLLSEIYSYFRSALSV